MTQDFAVTPGMCFLSFPRLERLASPSTCSFSLVLPYGLLENGRIGFLVSSPLLAKSGGSSLLESSTGTNSLLVSCLLSALCILFSGTASDATLPRSALPDLSLL